MATYYGIKGTRTRTYDADDEQVALSKLGGWGYNVIQKDEYDGWQQAYGQGVKQYGRPTSSQAVADMEKGKQLVAEYLSGLGKTALQNTMPTKSREEMDKFQADNLAAAKERFASDPANKNFLNNNSGGANSMGTKYGDILNIDGQKINPLDPNYSTYAKQLGITQGQADNSSPQGEVTKLTTGQSVVRDMNKEKAALAEFGKIYGKMPESAPEWQKLHDLAYAGDKSAAIPEGFEKIGHPDQIGQYEAIQRVGKVGDAGSYLIGKKKVDIPNIASLGGNTTGTGGTAFGGQAGASQGGSGGEGGTDNYRTFLMEKLNEIVNMQKSQPSATDLYTGLAQKLGISDYQKDIEGVQGQIRQTEDLLDNLESDISSRISGKGVSDALRRRYMSIESKPLNKQLADLYASRETAQSGLTSAKSTLSDMYQAALADRNTGIENITSLLPFYQEAMTYQTPQEQLAAKIAEEKALQEAGINEKPSTSQDISMISKGYNYVSTPAERDQLKAKGYSIVQVGGRTYAKEPEKKSGGGTKAADNSFRFESADKQRLLGAGLSLTDVASIQDNMNNGYSLDEIFEASPGISEAQKTVIRNSLSGVTEQKFTSDNIKSIAVNYVKSVGVEKAKEIINNGQISVNGKNINLPQSDIDKILAEIDSAYPEGRTTLQRILPWGK